MKSVIIFARGFFALFVFAVIVSAATFLFVDFFLTRVGAHPIGYMGTLAFTFTVFTMLRCGKVAMEFDF